MRITTGAAATPRALAAALTAGLVVTALACTPSGESPAPQEETSGGAPALMLPDGAEAAAQQITSDGMAADIQALAADDLEGRGPGTEGDRKARAYLIHRLEEIGLEPGAADGSWEQPFGIVGIDAKVPERWSFRGAGDHLDLAWWQDFIAASGVQQEHAVVDDAELVFVGYGIVAPEYDWDDYGDADLTGKVLVMLNNDPDWDPELFEGNRRLYYGRWTYKYESAAAQGAAAAIIIHTDESAGYPWQVVQSSWSGELFELPALDEPRLQVAAWTTWDAAERLFHLAGKDLSQLVESAKSRDFEPVPLGLRTSLTLDNRISRGVETANVLGRLPGSDPALADQVVIYTAHHDHLGRGKADATGDDIYNGARDNASGVAETLAIAEAFAALPQPPRRSVLFALVAAEEQGLLGSKYLATHPPVPTGRIALDVNYDSGNIWGRTKDVVFIGYGKSSLDSLVEAAAARQDRYVVGDQFPDRGFFYRSDQFSFAKVGVPSVYLESGTDFRQAGLGREQIEEWEQTHYHQPSDEYESSWNLEGMVEDAQVGFYVGLAAADQDALPTWNPGDEFEAARQEALAAVQQDR